jgi:hypothetical protein
VGRRCDWNFKADWHLLKKISNIAVGLKTHPHPIALNFLGQISTLRKGKYSTMRSQCLGERPAVPNMCGRLLSYCHCKYESEVIRRQTKAHSSPGLRLQQRRRYTRKIAGRRGEERLKECQNDTGCIGLRLRLEII